LLIPRLHQKVLQSGVIVGVEPAGVWFESQDAMNALLQSLAATTASYNLAFFVPFHEIAFAMTRGSAQALNEKSFGV
jgi:hypothetical protein